MTEKHTFSLFWGSRISLAGMQAASRWMLFNLWAMRSADPWTLSKGLGFVMLDFEWVCSMFFEPQSLLVRPCGKKTILIRPLIRYHVIPIYSNAVGTIHKKYINFKKENIWNVSEIISSINSRYWIIQIAALENLIAHLRCTILRPMPPFQNEGPDRERPLKAPRQSLPAKNDISNKGCSWSKGEGTNNGLIKGWGYQQWVFGVQVSTS